MAPFLILLLKQALSQRCSLKHARTTHNEFVVQTNHCQSPAAHTEVTFKPSSFVLVSVVNEQI